MIEEPSNQVARFTLLILISFTLTPLVGLGAAQVFGLTRQDELLQVLAHGALPLLLGTMLIWTAIYFQRRLRPVFLWAHQHPEGAVAPAHLHQRLTRFSRDYWSLFCLYSLSTPVLYFFGLHGDLSQMQSTIFFNFLLLQLCGAVLVGLPVYLLAQDRIGYLVSRLSLQKVQLSLKSKTLLLGGFVPLVS